MGTVGEGQLAYPRYSRFHTCKPCFTIGDSDSLDEGRVVLYIRRRYIMKTTIQLWGNSLAVRIPKSLAQETALGQGDEVNLRADDDRIVVERPQPKIYRLSDILAAVTKANRHTETDSGLPVGRETW